MGQGWHRRQALHSAGPSETVQSQASAGKIEKFKLKQFSGGCFRRAIGQKIGTPGPHRHDPKEMDQAAG
jgi:pyruvate,water dikinase